MSLTVELPLRIESCANRRELIERLWARSEPVPEAGCWLWMGDAVRTGHGRIHLREGKRLVHRVSYAIHHGKIPAGAVVMHKCDTPNCWNPDHLCVGSQLENVRDRDTKGRTARGDRHARLNGEDNGASRLNEAEVRSIRRLYARGVPQREIAERHGIGQMTVSYIVRRKTWAHVE